MQWQPSDNLLSQWLRLRSVVLQSILYYKEQNHNVYDQPGLFSAVVAYSIEYP